MEIVEFVPQVCNCVTRIQNLDAERQRVGYPAFWTGSVVRCDCKSIWMLNDLDGLMTWVIVQEVPLGLPGEVQ